MPRSSLAPALALAANLFVIASTGALAAPPGEEAGVAIPPNREDAARALLEGVHQTEALRFQGPRIERDRIKWWLMRGDEARGMLLLLPRKLGERGDPRSESFAIQVGWAPEIEPSAEELALMDSAVTAVQAEDHGGFYVFLIDTVVDEFPPGDVDEPTAPYAMPIDPDPDRVRSRWAWELLAVASISALAIAVSLRRRPADPSPSPE